MELGETREDYLEAIYVLKHKRGQVVKNIRVAEYMKLSKPSVSYAVKGLEKLGYLYKGEGQELCLTVKGECLGRRVYERHVFFKKFLEDIGVEEKVADHEACHLEHIFCEDTYRLFKKYVKQSKG